MISVSVDIAAPLDAVWAEAADLASHVEWMRDAERIEFIGTTRTGKGTVMEVLTKIGPLRTTDVIEVTSWREREEIGVTHRGVVTGSGRFLLEALAPDRTRFTWEEQLELPWYFGGALGAPISSRVLAAVWRANLARFKQRIEGSASDR